MPYYNSKRSAENIRGLKMRRKQRAQRGTQSADGMSKPYTDMSGGMTNVKKRKPTGMRRIRYDKM